jgi:hypothetical protein
MLRNFRQKVERIVNLEITMYSGHQRNVAGARKGQTIVDQIAERLAVVR